MNQIGEIRQELRDVVFGRVGIADGVIPPLLFVVSNALWGVVVASVLGLGSAAGITIWRLLKGRPIRFALAGLFGTALGSPSLSCHVRPAGSSFPGSSAVPVRPS